MDSIVQKIFLRRSFMEKTVSRIEVLKCMVWDLETGAERSNYKGEIYRSIVYLIASDCNDHLNGRYHAFSEDFKYARNNSKLFDLVYLMDPSKSPEDLILIDILYQACYNDYYETVKYLIKQGVDINYTSKSPQGFYDPKYLFTELYNLGYIDIAYLLLDAGIKIDPHDYVDRKSERNNEKCEVISYLIQKMYNLKQKTSKGVDQES